MRDDMGKITIDKPRYGKFNSHENAYQKISKPREKRYFKGVEDDLRPKHESMKRRHIVNYGGKRLSDYLAPLERYLQSNAGRKWNDVWSEICQTLTGNGLQANHIKEHVKMFVDMPYDRPYGGLYVDDDGILQWTKPKKTSYIKPVYFYKKESDTVEWHKVNGCWYRMEWVCECEAHTDRGFFFPARYGWKKKAINSRNARRLNLDSAWSYVKPKWKG